MRRMFICTFFLIGAAVFAKGEQAGSGKSVYAYVSKNTGNPYIEKSMEGFKNAIEELGGEAIVTAPDRPTVEGQIEIIERFIAQQVKVIVVAANDRDALTPVLKKAKSRGIKVISSDSALSPESRILHVNQADSEAIGRIEVQAASEMIGGEGEIAILSATSQATNQNTWIGWMKKELAKPEYSKIRLVKVAYGDDLRDKSVSETEGLLKTFPNLRAIIAPTTVGIAAAAKVITDKGLIGKVMVTGLGLPSEMREYILNGTCPWMYLWNPIDLGYLTGYVAVALDKGEITGKAGETVKAGRLGEKALRQDQDGGIEVPLGPPFRFDKNNIEEWAKIY